MCFLKDMYTVVHVIEWLFKNTAFYQMVLYEYGMVSNDIVLIHPVIIWYLIIQHVIGLS